MNYFLYNPVTQYDNTGDLLINKSLVALLKKHGQVIIDDKDKPASFISQLLSEGDQRLSAVTDKRLFDFIEDQLQETEMGSQNTYYLVFVPGDLSVIGFKKALSRLRFFYTRLRKLKQLGCRIIRLGVSLNTFDVPNMIAESLYSRAYYLYGIRDKQSIAEAMRFRFSHIRYFPDLAWAYRPNLTERDRDLEGKYILISFRANRSGTVHDSHFFSTIKNQLFVLLSHSLFHNYKIIVSYQVQYDREAAQELVDLFANEFEVKFIDRLLSLDEATHLYTHADLVISNRLHVLLLGSICNTLSIPFINPLDNKKIAGIYEDNAMNDLVLDYRNNAAELRAKLINLAERRNIFSSLLEDNRKQNAQLIESTVIDIVNS